MEKNKVNSAANFYFQKGWNVVPFDFKKATIENEKIKKQVVFSFDYGQYHNEKITPDLIQKWWGKYNSIAVVTGAISNLTVIDIDIKDLPEMGDLPETFCVETNKGFHFYFSHTEEVKTGSEPFKKSNGEVFTIDIRNNGGIVYAPPSNYELPDGKKVEYKIIKNIPIAPFPPNWFSKIRSKYEKLTGGKNEEKKDWGSILNTVLKEGEGRNSTGTSLLGKLFSKYDISEWDYVVKPLFISWSDTHSNPPLSQQEKETLYESVKKTVIRRQNSGKVIGETLLDSTDDVITATVPYEEGLIQFYFTDFEFGNKSCEVIMKCGIDTKKEGKGSIFEQRINLYSGSAKSEAVRQLNNAFGKNINWTLVLFDVCPKVIELVKHKNRPIDYNPNGQKAESMNLLKPFLEDKSINILFGDGGSCKTFLSLKMGIAVAWNIDFFGIKPLRNTNVLFIDYEDTKITFDDRIKRLLNGSKIENNCRFLYYKPQGLSINDIKSVIREYIIKDQIGLVIIDSAGDACGGEPSEAKVALQLVNTLNNIGTAVLLIAHQTKTGEGKYPFGSIFFHNGARSTWNIKMDSETEENSVKVGLFQRKYNHGAKSKPYGAKIEFNEDKIAISEASTEVWAEELSDKDKILSALEEGTIFDLKELSEETGIKYSVLKARLSDLKRKGLIEGERGSYVLSNKQKSNENF